jgi:predicted hotdog family 3-hydroxylacyl-ACP dehydratase
MAQAIAAWSGWQARRRDATPRIGYLLGTRRYDSQRTRFAVGEELVIHVHRLFQADNGLAQFEARIEIAGEIVASAALNVFEPPANPTSPADVP